MNILILDDLETNRLVLEKAIKIISPNSKILTGKNGQEGLDICKINYFDLIFVDVKMPLINGFEFLRRFNYKRESKPYIVLLSAYDMNKEQSTDLEKVDYIIQKPFSLLGLRNLLMSIKQNK